jgi:hypothetical protein
MDAETQTPASQNGATKSMLGKAWDFMVDHPKTSMLVGAGVSVVAGAELIAAALVGGAVTLVFAPRRRA